MRPRLAPRPNCVARGDHWKAPGKRSQLTALMRVSRCPEKHHAADHRPSESIRQQSRTRPVLRLRTHPAIIVTTRKALAQESAPAGAMIVKNLRVRLEQWLDSTRDNAPREHRIPAPDFGERAESLERSPRIADIRSRKFRPVGARTARQPPREFAKVNAPGEPSSGNAADASSHQRMPRIRCRNQVLQPIRQHHTIRIAEHENGALRETHPQITRRMRQQSHRTPLQAHLGKPLDHLGCLAVLR